MIRFWLQVFKSYFRKKWWEVFSERFSETEITFAFQPSLIFNDFIIYDISQGQSDEIFLKVRVFPKNLLKK